MRVLQINKFFFRRGGAEAVFFATIEGLRRRGHEVAEFSTQSRNNLSSDYSAFFAPAVPELSQVRDWETSIRIFRRLFRSKEMENNLNALIAAVEPQVAHLHNVYHHFSAGLFHVLKKRGIPIALTVHDVQPMCPNHRMVRGTGEALCEKCYRHRYYNCWRYRCIHKSRGHSAVGALEAYYWHLKNIWDLVDIFICPSQFMLDKMVQWGFSKEKMHLARNPFEAPSDYPALGTKIAYLGRFHPEKGIRFLARALCELRDYKAVVAGDGPDGRWLEIFARQYSLGNVEISGWVHGEAWRRLISEARVVVVPSLFYENCSMTILEALANGRLVVAADRGGNRELIINGATGFLVAPENSDALAMGIRQAMNLSTSAADEMGRAGRALVLKNHDPGDYFDRLEKIYAEVKR